MEQAAESGMRYFVGHQLTKETTDDLRGVVSRSLEPIGHKPCYADAVLEGQTLLFKICQKIFLSRFSIFDLSSPNPNVYLEMGIALGLNRPIIAIAKEGTRLPPVLQGHNVVMYGGYAELEAALPRLCGQGLPPTTQVLPDYCPFCGRVCDSMATTPDENSCLVLDSAPLLWRDVMWSIGPHLAERQLHPIRLTEKPFGPLLCDMRRKVLSCQFTICHLGLANESGFLALGMAIGSGVPWLLLSKHTDPVPSNLQGFDRIEYESLTGLKEQLAHSLDGFLEVAMPSRRQGSGATALIESTPFWNQFRDWIDQVAHASQATEAIQGRIRLVQYEGPKFSSKYIIPQEGLIFGRGSECDVVLKEQYVSLRHFRILKARSQRYFIEDLDSKNGTLLNGASLSRRVKVALSFGDKVSIPGSSVRFVIWDDRPLPGSLSSQPPCDTVILPPFLTVEIPDVSPPIHLQGLDLSLTLNTLHPLSNQNLMFEIQAYYPIGRTLAALTSLIGLPQRRYRLKFGDRFIADDETPLSAGIKGGSFISIVTEEAEEVETT